MLVHQTNHNIQALKSSEEMLFFLFLPAKGFLPKSGRSFCEGSVVPLLSQIYGNNNNIFMIE